jgi:hypothetical protein
MPDDPSMRSRNSARNRSHDGITSLARFGNGGGALEGGGVCASDEWTLNIISRGHNKAMRIADG